jgi:cytosine/adenosine deaminase-related metal-dependent hydrolase
VDKHLASPSGPFDGCYALPGLIDMHVHLPPDNALQLTQGAALLYLSHGVTSIREAGDLDGTAVDAARELSKGGVHPVPRVFSCGPFVGAGKATFKNTILLPDGGKTAADAAARAVKATGASFMKFYDGLTEPMIRSLERACAEYDLKIMGHVPSAISYQDARIAEVQHFFGVPDPATLERDALVNRSCDWHAVDERRMDRIIEATMKHGIANTPTIVRTRRCFAI